MTQTFRPSALISLSLFFFLALPVAAAEDEKVKFSSVDLNGDGLISEAEMTEWRENKFKARDVDGDGIISRQDLLQEAKDGSRAMTWDETAEFILSYDRDGDLEISLKEVRHVITRSRFFQIIDFDNSGFITPPEARNWLATEGLSVSALPIPSCRSGIICGSPVPR